MADNNSENTVKTAEKQSKGVPFTKDDPRINRNGRPKGSGISITTEIKKKLEEVPEGQKATYLELLINRIMKQAIQDGDGTMIAKVWAYIDGLPKQSIDMTTDGESLNTFTDEQVDRIAKRRLQRATDGGSNS